MISSALKPHLNRVLIELEKAPIPFSIHPGAFLTDALLAGQPCLSLRRLTSLLKEHHPNLQEKQLKIWLTTESDVVGRTNTSLDRIDTAPLVFEKEHLYFTRYWRYETRVAQRILERAALKAPLLTDVQKKTILLDRLFGEYTGGLQREAVQNILDRPFNIISGGPGTGKTYTLARAVIAMVLARQAEGQEPLSIRCVAPTGKAAMRMEEALKQAFEQIALSPEEKQLLEKSQHYRASTLHRLLGGKAESIYFKHDALRPLPLDVLIVDEGSMIDLALMSKLLEALPEKTRLILLGDKDQLPPVEVGGVFPALCDEKAKRLAANRVFLTESQRFHQTSAIGRLAQVIHQQDEEGLRHLLNEKQTSSSEGVQWHPSIENLHQHLIKGYAPFFEQVGQFSKQLKGAARIEALNALFHQLRQFAVLSPFRQGREGVIGLNTIIEKTYLKKMGEHKTEEGGFYQGKVVMISENHYGLNLFNGDIGITLPNEEGQLRVYFERDLIEEAGVSPYHDFSYHHLPKHETAFAITVHKSQGSEFGTVALVLPTQSDSPHFVSRALFYTGLTRTRHHLHLWGSEAVFLKALKTQGEDESLLAARLAGD